MPSAATRPLATVERAVAVLDALAAAPEGLGTGEVARRAGTNASTASRLLATLAAAGLVERGEGARGREGARGGGGAPRGGASRRGRGGAAGPPVLRLRPPAGRGPP